MVHDGTGRPGGTGAETVVPDRRAVGHGGGRRVLVVEDEPNIAEAIRFILRRDGWTVETQDNGLAAQARIQAAPPDLVILDVMLPGQSGLDVFQALRRAPATARLPVILLSARGHAVARELAADRGVSMFMSKPFANAELLAAVRQLVGV